MAKEKWVMPKWMEPFRESFNNTGGNTVETLLNRLQDDKNLGFTNFPVLLLASCALSQVELLTRLHNEDRLILEPR